MGFGGLRNLVTTLGRGRARQLLNLLQPAAQMSGVRPIQEGARRAAVNAGLIDELTAFPSVVSQRGGNLGLMGTRTVPTARQLGQAPIPQWGGANIPAGARPVNQLRPQPYQGPRTRGGDIVPTTSPTMGAAPTRTQFTEDLINARPPQGPVRPPVQGPSMTGNPVQGQLDLRFGPGARSVAEFTTSKGAVRPVGTNIAGQPYRGGPVATAENIEQIRGSLAPRVQPRGLGEEISNKVAPGQGSFFLENAPDIWTDAFRMRPELIRQLPADVQRRIGTTMMREAADLGPQAPIPAFGPNAGPAPVDSIASQAFARGAAAGNELVDLGALLSNPAIRTALGLGGLGAIATGVASMGGDRDRTGETTAGSPPDAPGSVPPALFLENDGTPLGTAPGVAPTVVAPSTTNIDPVATNAVVTTGNVQADSARREALNQFSPNSAAVLRAVEPMSPEKYRSIEEYAAARQAFAQAQPEIRELMRYMETQSPTAGGGLAMWAYSNQNLAQNYQAQQQALKNPAMSQQGTGSVTSEVLTAPIGSENTATAPYNAAITAEAETGGGQAAQMLKQVTSPNRQPYLQRTEDFIQRQAPRSAMYAGY